ncbi:hypothetical protein LP420_17725 [Massilia sp. B-10]|nr:hypothetical protein LP420_17725 [Massilia sp. B-10]
MIIAAYTSSQVWRKIAAELPPARRLNMTAIYAEPGPADQLKLVSLLYKRPVRVAAIVSGETRFLKPLLDGANAVEIEDYAAGADINYALNRVGQAQVLLAMPDRTVYSAENFRNILLSTYRHNQGVIGFSADMVRWLRWRRPTRTSNISTPISPTWPTSLSPPGSCRHRSSCAISGRLSTRASPVRCRWQ